MIDPQSNAFAVYRSYHGRSVLEERDGRNYLFTDETKTTSVEAIALQDAGERKFIAWIEKQEPGFSRLLVYELKAYAHRLVEWTIDPCDGGVTSWIFRWKNDTLHLVYNDGDCYYAVRVKMGKDKEKFFLQVMELGEMIATRKDGLIGFSDLQNRKTVGLFDLRTFAFGEEMSVEAAKIAGFVPHEWNQFGEEME